MILLDANYILRFLLKDNLEMFKISKDCIINNECIVLNEVIAEVVFVLLKVYNVEKEDISKTLIDFLTLDNIIIDDEQIVVDALIIFKDRNIDFVDSILCAKSKECIVKTFDKKLNKCIKNKVIRGF